jgi:mannose-6-phosphate isomerase-like protein (cupin superfamily)
MAITLEGGCLVAELRDGSPRIEEGVRIWDHFGKGSGAEAISLRVLEIDGDATLRNEAFDEVLYVISGEGKADRTPVAPDMGIEIPAGMALSLSSTSTLTIVSSRCPASGGQRESRIVRMEDRPAQKTGDREYRELIQGEVTQFVGSIPPGRAPDHFHLYEEVICILEGHGAMWAGATSTEIAPGSCIFLPKRQIHCVENRSAGLLRLLGVFYPAGSPAVRYSA